MTKKEFLAFISNSKEDVLQQLLDLLGYLGFTWLTQLTQETQRTQKPHVPISYLTAADCSSGNGQRTERCIRARRCADPTWDRGFVQILQVNPQLNRK